MSVPEEKDNDLADLLPDREVKLSTGETVTVRPLHWVQLPKGAVHIERVITAAMQVGLITEEGDLNLSALMGLIAAAGGHVNELILMCTYRDGERVPREWLDTVSVEDGLDLTSAVIVANWRESIGKKLESLSMEIQALFEAGVVSSNGSSPTDTDGPTSSSTPSDRSIAS